MIDTHPCATPTQAPPVATVTSPEALPPSPAPPPHAVAPAVPVTDPVSNLDFLPVDDAFALEMRSETIEQLVGGDALRRGVSERIEAGRSHTNADLVAGRDRVRVHATLHEHTGHGLAEMAAHLHTTVDGTLDVHAGNEDTVLLAGHMSELWDGSTAIVAAMTDDTVAGGGIRVTTPLDLWVHGLMGVEERIGTCTADAVLTESSATHYEREYGPGVHAAGLAVYTGSLYQSSRSTFRPLMRVSSGVRNLIAAGDGGGAGSDGGAGDAPSASPPPVPARTGAAAAVPAQTGAAAESAFGTLAAGRGAAETPATALDAADALTDARRVPLEELVDPVDARAAEQMGEAGTVMRAEDLPELTRCADTAEQLGALRETLRIDKTASGSEAAGGSRASELAGAGSMHPASGGGGPLEIDPSSAVHGENARLARPYPDVPWGQGQVMQPGLPGGADRPPPSAAPESDFHTAYRRLRELGSHYHHISRMDIRSDYHRVVIRLNNAILGKFTKFGGNTKELAHRPSATTQADQAYDALHDMASQAERDRDFGRAGEIREALGAIDKRAVEALQELTTKHGIPETPFIQAVQQPPAAAEPTMAVTGIPPPPYTPGQTDWIAAYRQLRGLFDIPGPAYPIAAPLNPAYTEPAGGLVHATDVPGPGAVSGLPGPSLAEAAGAEASDLGRWRLDPTATVSGTTAAHPTATETIVTPALGETSSFWLQPVDPVPVSVPFDAGLHHAGETVRPPPLTTTASSTAPAPGASFHVPAWVTDDFHVERAVLAGELPRGFDASQLVRLARRLGEAELGEELAAGRLPLPTIDLLMNWYRTTNDRGRNTLLIENLDSLRESIESALRDAYPGRVDRKWLEYVWDTMPPRWRSELAAPSVASTAGPAELDVAEIDRLREMSVGDNFDVERNVLAGTLPPGFDTSQLVRVARRLGEPGLAEELAARRLPLQTIDRMIEELQAANESGRHTRRIGNLSTLKASIERALLDAYPGRVDREWLDHVRHVELPRRHGVRPAPSAASAAGSPLFDATEILRLRGTGEGVSHPALLPPPSAAGRTGAGAGAPPPAADPWRIRPPGMGGEPHPVAFDPRSAPPGPSSQVRPTDAIRTPVMSTGAPPGWQGAETPGFARAASGAVELSFSRREAIARRFRSEDAVLQAELVLQTEGGEALRWSATRWRPVLADLEQLHDTAEVDLAAAVAMTDIDWRAIEALARILHVPLPSP